jgi:hypothetical protein
VLAVPSEVHDAEVILFQPKHVSQICPECREIVEYTAGTGECNMVPSGKTEDSVEVMKDRCNACDPTQRNQRTRMERTGEKANRGEGHPPQHHRREHL